MQYGVTMKKLICLILLAATCGCVNLYTRCPGTDKEIVDTYQCTQEMIAWTCIIAWPQAMSPDCSDKFYPINVITIPLAIIPAADTCLEAVVDTVFYPYDYYTTKGKNKNRRNDLWQPTKNSDVASMTL